MKKVQFLLIVSVIATVLMSACGATAATPTIAGGGTGALPVAFVGLIESIAGDQWVIDGNTVTVTAAVVRDGPFAIGDQVKVEGTVNVDGSFTVSRVEPPTAADVSSLPRFGALDAGSSNTNDANTNDANVNADNSNTAITNDDNSNSANSNDDNGNSVNSNDDNSNSANSNDDNANDANSNDDDGNGNDDDSGGNDNGDDNGSDDDDDNSND
jgi:hypothetical protein